MMSIAPEVLDVELVHEVCNVLRFSDPDGCRKCPRIRESKNYGPCISGCWMLAEQVIAIVRKRSFNPLDESKYVDIPSVF